MHGCRLHKGAFRDALCLRHGWQLTTNHIYLPIVCVERENLMVEHTFSCSCGGFPTLRHNDRNITAYNVRVELELHPLTREEMKHKTANSEEGARLDICVSGF